MCEVFGLISPHLDDVVLSCSRFLVTHPGAHVLTVFAGGPRHVDPLPEWDRYAQAFSSGDDVMALRRQEDVAALEMLSAVPHHLGYWDQQYRSDAYGYQGPVTKKDLVASIANDLADAIARLRVDAWVMPLGLQHPDHVYTAAASARAFWRSGERGWFVYEELPYRAGTESRRSISWARRRLRANGYLISSEKLSVSEDFGLKQAAIECHRSQLPGLGAGVDTAVRSAEVVMPLSSVQGSRLPLAALRFYSALKFTGSATRRS